MQVTTLHRKFIEDHKSSPLVTKPQLSYEEGTRAFAERFYEDLRKLVHKFDGMSKEELCYETTQEELAEVCKSILLTNEFYKAGTTLPENLTHTFLRFVIKNVDLISSTFAKDKARIVLVKTVRTYVETPLLLEHHYGELKGLAAALTSNLEKMSVQRLAFTTDVLLHFLIMEHGEMSR